MTPQGANTPDTIASAGDGSAADVRKALQRARRELLDLSTRNRLLSTVRRRQRSSSIEIIDERAAEVFRVLVSDRRAMTFLPRPEKADIAEGQRAVPVEKTAAPPTPAPLVPETSSADNPASVAGDEGERDEDAHGEAVAAPIDDAIVFDEALLQPDESTETDETLDGSKPLPRHADDKLQTGMTSAVLQQRLLRTYYAARTFEEEQGANILYLAIGFLKWFESESSERERFAPLLLIPVQLERPSAAARFRIRWTEEDITTNLSLKEKFKSEFGVDLPDVPVVDDLDPAEYFGAVRQSIAAMQRWEVLDNDIVLWFFSFAKLLMYRDLDPANWPEDRAIDRNALVSGLLCGGVRAEPPLCGEDDPIDPLLPPLSALHVMDADSSQAIAIEEVRRGRDMVIQGPPGTRKSQTIANLIAAAVKQGQRVLFVAEKMAALDVVKSRLERIGLGDMCLALHSHNTRKQVVLRELERTLGLERPIVGDVPQTAEQLAEARDALNRHAQMMHTPLAPSGLTPYRVVGELVQLRAGDVPPTDFVLPDAALWTAEQLRSRTALVRELASFIEQIGQPSAHPFRGVGIAALLPMDRDRLTQRLPGAIERLQTLQTDAASLAQVLHIKAPATGAEVTRVAELGRHIGAAPPLDTAAFADDVWETQRGDIADLVATGRAYVEHRAKLDGVINDAA